MQDGLRFAVIGGGMAGILAGIKLKEAGLEDFTIYEKADRLGGTWRENTYPGLTCDVPSHVYCYSFALNPEWSQRFAPGPEIQAYFVETAERFGLIPKTRFGEEILKCEWRDGQWNIEMTSGHKDVVDVVITATGVLHHPNIPKFPGQDSFEGHIFHSARWDHSVPVEGKRIGVVGTGSTAVQLTSALIGSVAHLSLFQRTPQWLFVEDNFPITTERRAEFRRDPVALDALHRKLSESFRKFLSDALLEVDSPRMREVEELCRTNLETYVSDPELREKLRPDYRAGCKRLIMSGSFYSAIQQPNASLVTSPIARLEPSGVRTEDGVLHELDVLVLATGFKTDQYVRPMRVVGRNGVTLEDVWANGPVAYLAITVPDIPNFFMLNGPNGPVGNFSTVGVVERQVAYTLQLVDLLRRGERKEIVPTAEAMRQFENERVEAARKTVWSSGCRSWYLDAKGVPATWTFSYDRFLEEMAAPRLDHFEGAEDPDLIPTAATTHT